MAQQVGGEIVPPAAPARLRIELQGRVPTRDGGGGFGGGRRQGRPAEVGVKDDPGGVDDWPQAGTPQLQDHALDRRPARSGFGDRPSTTLRLDGALHGEPDQRPAVLGDHGGGGLLLEQVVNAGQGPQAVHRQPPTGKGGKLRMNRRIGV